MRLSWILNATLSAQTVAASADPGQSRFGEGMAWFAGASALWIPCLVA